MARKKGFQGDFNLNTRAYAGSTSPEQVEASRVQASGRSMPPPNPKLMAYGKAEVESRVKRTVMGIYENQGRSPMHVLTPGQFAQFSQTGGWEGMPSREQYGPQSAGPDDREWEST